MDLVLLSRELRKRSGKKSGLHSSRDDPGFIEFTDQATRTISAEGKSLFVSSIWCDKCVECNRPPSRQHPPLVSTNATGSAPNSSAVDARDLHHRDNTLYRSVSVSSRRQPRCQLLRPQRRFSESRYQEVRLCLSSGGTAASPRQLQPRRMICCALGASQCPTPCAMASRPGVSDSGCPFPPPPQ